MSHFEWDELHPLQSIQAIAERVGFETPHLRQWAEHDQYDEYWAAIDQSLMHEHIRIPGYHVGGWFDHLTRSQYEAYQNIRDRGATELARSSQRLLIGPWGHTTTGNTGPEHCRYGEWDFGNEADLSVMAHELQFFDHYMKDLDNGYSEQPPVKLFLMGENRWVTFEDWPPPEARIHSYFLDSNGSANMRIGDGSLKQDAPEKSAADSFDYDPADPVPTRGGATYWGLPLVGPIDQRPILDRSDVLYYRSDKLSAPLTVVGEVNLALNISTDAEDTDFIAKLCVEEPNGAITCLTLGSLRCRYRNSWSEPEPLSPGEVTPIRIQLGHTAYVFPEGSRIGLMVTSSDFPRIQPHPNRIASPWSLAEPVTARNSVAHGPGALSRVDLPVVDF